jgi:hypothetical protein
MWMCISNWNVHMFHNCSSELLIIAHYKYPFRFLRLKAVNWKSVMLNMFGCSRIQLKEWKVITFGSYWAYRIVILLDLFAYICLYVILYRVITSSFTAIRRTINVLTQCSYDGVIVSHYNHFPVIDCDRSIDEMKRTRLFARRTWINWWHRFSIILYLLVWIFVGMISCSIRWSKLR